MSTVRDFYNFLDEIAPFAAQEGWDNSGFLVGDGSRRAEKSLWRSTLPSRFLTRPAA